MTRGLKKNNKQFYLLIFFYTTSGIGFIFAAGRATSWYKFNLRQSNQNTDQTFLYSVSI